MFKRCTLCKINKKTSDFYWDKSNGVFLGKCKACHYINHSKAMSKYSKSKKGKESINKAARKAYRIHKDKWIARAKARYAILKGIIKKPKKCEVCEVPEQALQAHHEDYTKPLEVIFLCYSCHATADKLLESLTN